MKLPMGIVVDQEATFGELLFSAKRKDNFVTDENGEVTKVVKDKRYDCMSKKQGQMIQVILPADSEDKEFEYKQPVKLVNIEMDAVANGTTNYDVKATWYVKASDIVAIDQTKTGQTQTQAPKQQHNQQSQQQNK